MIRPNVLHRCDLATLGLLALATFCLPISVQAEDLGAELFRSFECNSKATFAVAVDSSHRGDAVDIDLYGLSAGCDRRTSHVR